MTSNERKIIKCLRGAKGKAHIRNVAQKTNFTSDYTRLLCHSLARAGYIKLEDSNICRLLKKGHGYFENVAAVAEKFEPVMATAKVTLFTDESVGRPLASDRDNEDEEDQGNEDGNKDGYQPASDDVELDKALADEEETKIAEAEAELKPESAESEEIKELETSEKAGPKEESVKPSGGLGIGLKKIVNWFAEKK